MPKSKDKKEKIGKFIKKFAKDFAAFNAAIYPDGLARRYAVAEANFALIKDLRDWAQATGVDKATLLAKLDELAGGIQE